MHAPLGARLSVTPREAKPASSQGLPGDALPTVDAVNELRAPRNAQPSTSSPAPTDADVMAQVAGDVASDTAAVRMLTRSGVLPWSAPEAVPAGLAELDSRRQALAELLVADGTRQLAEHLQQQLRHKQCALPVPAGWSESHLLAVLIVGTAAEHYREALQALRPNWMSLSGRMPDGAPLPARLLSPRQYLDARTELMNAGLYDLLLDATRPLRRARPVWRKSGRTAPADTPFDNIIKLFAAPGLYRLAERCPTILLHEPAANAVGRQSPYPRLLKFGLGVCARIAQGHNPTGTLIADEEQYAKIVKTFQHAWASVLPDRPVPAVPSRPPSGEKIRQWWQDTAEAGHTWQLVLAFTHVALAQARRQGVMQPGVGRDFTAPSLGNYISADGMFTPPFSTAPAETADGRRLLTVKQLGCTPQQLFSTAFSTVQLNAAMHPDAGITSWREGTERFAEPGWPPHELRQSSRPQVVHTTGSADGKSDYGLNHLAAHVRTEHGRLALGVDCTFGNEGPGAEQLLNRISDASEDAVHGVIYDRALTGSHFDRFMATRGQALIGKSVGDNTPRSGSDLPVLPGKRKKLTLNEQEAAQLDHVVARLMAEEDLEEGSRTYQVRFLEVRRAYLRRMLNEQPLPVGLSVYPTSGGNFDIIRSVALPLRTVQHTGDDGKVCTHNVYVDDGAAWDVNADPGTGDLVKTGLWLCSSAVPAPARGRRAAGTFEEHSRWARRCGQQTITFTVEWKPRLDGAALSEWGRAEHLLRPVNRADAQLFWYLTGLRSSDAESSHAAYQRTLPFVQRKDSKPHAGSWHPAQQLLDLLAFCLVTNALTWHRFVHDDYY